MLDVQILANRPDTVRDSLRRRHAAPEHFETVDRLVDLIHERRRLQVAIDQQLALRNTLSPQIGKMLKNGPSPEAEALKEQVRLATTRAEDLKLQIDRIADEELPLLQSLPNLVADDTPDGRSDKDNPVIRQIGDLPAFPFAPRAHDDLAADLGMYHPESGVKLAGSRFAVTSGALARMERALVQFFLDLHTDHHGYREWVVPYMVTRTTLTGTGQLPKFEEDLFKLAHPLANEDAFLIPTAEVPVTNLHRGDILEEESLPRKYCAFTPCFRSEAGSWGKDTRGMIRLHQFHKVELVWICTPEQSSEGLETLTAHAETCLQRLDLPYQVVARCTADVGNGGAKGYDLEVWLPAQNTYREISSCTSFTDFQARRLQLRTRRGEGKNKKTLILHTLNGSGLAVGRTIAAILENFQQADGSVTIPTALRPYMGGLDALRKGM